MWSRHVRSFSSNCKLLSLALLGTTAYAIPAAAEPSEVTTSGGIETVIVTAERRSENLQNVSIAANAFSSDQIRELGADSLQDLVKSIPNVTLYDDRGAGQPTWIIRGVGLADFNQNNTPTAATFYDEFYLPSNAVSGLGLYDIERVEVLKGPQGGLYGRNTTGGAVRVLSQKPTFDAFSGYIDGTYGSWKRTQARGAINIPLADNLAVRVAGMVDRGGGWQDSLATPQNDHWGDKGFSAMRAQIRYQPVSALDIDFKAEFGTDDSQTLLGRSIGTENLTKPLGPGGATISSGPNATFCDAVLAGHLDDATCGNWADRNALVLGIGPLPQVSDQTKNATVVLSNPINKLDNNWSAYNLRADYNLGFATLSSISGEMHYVYRQVFDYDGSSLDLGHENSHVVFNIWSQEFRLISNGEGPFAWQAGGIYNFDGIDDVRSFDFSQNPITAPPPVNFATRSYHQSTTAWAAYGQASYDINDQFKLHGAVRYTNEHKQMTDASVYIPAINYYLFQGVSESISLRKHWSGEIGLDYRLDTDKMVYLKMTHGYKSGGAFGGFSASANNLLPYQEETNTAYELGTKTLWWSELQLNGAAYFYDYGNKQGYLNQLNPPPFTGTSVRLGNIGDEHLYGVELDALWAPSEVPGLSLELSPSWYKGAVVSTSASAVSVSGAPISLTGPINPQWSYTAMARYDHPVFENLVGGIQFNYYRHGFGNGGSTAVTDPVSNAIYHISDYGQLDGRLSLSSQDTKWEVDFEIHNLTDAVFDTVVTRDSGGSYMGLYNQPRNFRITLHYAW